MIFSRPLLELVYTQEAFLPHLQWRSVAISGYLAFALARSLLNSLLCLALSSWGFSQRPSPPFSLHFSELADSSLRFVSFPQETLSLSRSHSALR